MSPRFSVGAGTPGSPCPSPHCHGGVPSLLSPSPGLSCPWPPQKGVSAGALWTPRALPGWRPRPPGRPGHGTRASSSTGKAWAPSTLPASAPRPGHRPPCPPALVLRRQDVTRRRGEGGGLMGEGPKSGGSWAGCGVGRASARGDTGDRRDGEPDCLARGAGEASGSSWTQREKPSPQRRMAGPLPPEGGRTWPGAPLSCPRDPRPGASVAVTCHSEAGPPRVSAGPQLPSATACVPALPVCVPGPSPTSS